MKWSEFTWAAAASSWNASTSTNWFGLSTLRDHSKKMLPGSDRVPWVNSSTSASQLPLRSGLMVHLTTMKIMDVPFGIDRGTAEPEPGRNWSA